MAVNIHLTNDNGAAAFGNPKDKLGAISTTQYGSHLVVIRQNTNWNNKEFVVTPDGTASYFCVGYSGGDEQYPNVQGGPNVYNDTNILVSNVRNMLNNGLWWVMRQNYGFMPVWSVSCRANGALYHYNNSRWSATSSEYGVSQVALKFNIHRIPLSKLTSFKAYIRCWGGSYVFCRQDIVYSKQGIIVGSNAYNNTSKLNVKLYESCPNYPAWNLAESADSFEFCNHVNNGMVVSRDVNLTDGCVCFDPFIHGLPSVLIRNKPIFNNLRVYTLQNSSDYKNPTNYYTDFEITNQDNLNLLKKNPESFYLVANFHVGNAFSDGNSGQHGIIQGGSLTCFAERIEFVLKCTGNSYNI